MNNSAFRDLVSGNKSNAAPASSQQHHEAIQKSNVTLGSRSRSSIPMTPRNIPGQRQNLRSDFVRQVNDATSSSRTDDDRGPPFKKFKTSSAPKGTRLASGYIDRANLLRHGNGGDVEVEDKEKRLKALEEMYKLQQIDQETFERLRSEIGIGGDVKSTHLVRGLDWELLKRVRQGEDVTKVPPQESADDPQDSIDVDAEFDKVLESESTSRANKDVSSVDMDEDVNVPPVIPDEPSRSMTRDEILRRLKQSRQDSQLDLHSDMAQASPALNDKFKKIPSAATGPKKERFTETVNGRRREVLLITAPDGSTKRKTRWLDPETLVPATDHTQVVEATSPTPTNGIKEKKSKQPKQNMMGMEVPAEIAAQEAARKAAEEQAAEDEDDDIFQGVGDDYDPLADIKSDESDAEHEKPEGEGEGATNEAPAEAQNAVKRNYFGTSTTDVADSHGAANPMSKDPTILAALKRAAEIRKREETQDTAMGTGNGDDTRPTDKSQAFLAKLREQERKDAADLDMGFGGSRFDDEDDEADATGLLNFDHEGDGDDDEHHPNGGKKGKGARKRGPSKKKKGDKNSFTDVMGVIEGRKGTS